MDKAELIDRAAPPCHQCGAPIQRARWLWSSEAPDLGDEREYHAEVTLICAHGHRTRVEEL